MSADESIKHLLRDINRRFADQYITVDQDWLTGCVEWFLSETPQISPADLYKSAYEQWLLSDLIESGIECLPQSVRSNKNEFQLIGNYALQMQYLIDIAESAYEQYRHIHGKKLDEAEEAEPGQRQRNVSKRRRTLKLELTDGHHTITAMEHCLIPCLTTKLYPGTKILVKGPLRCVNKVLFIQSSNVKILGGEVEKLSIENAYENVLLKAMGRPITSTPKLDYKEDAVVEQNRAIPYLPSVPPVPPHDQKQTANIIHDDDDDIFSNLDIDYLNSNVPANPSTNQSHPINVSTSHSSHTNHHQSTNVNQFLEDDDDIFFEADIPDASVIEPTIVNNAQSSNHVAFDDDDDDDFDMSEIEAKIQMEMQNNERRNMTNSRDNATLAGPAVQSTENSKYFDSDLDIMLVSESTLTDDSPTHTSTDITHRNYEFKVCGCPLVTILQLHSLDAIDKTERSFVVRCEVFRTVDSIRIVLDQYHLVVIVKDSTDMELEVKVSNDVVAEWADVTAAELQRMRSVMNQRPQQRQQMENILKKLSDTIAEFDGFMRIEYTEKNERPEVTAIIESKAEYNEILKKKLKKAV